jgi:hypothetical protein
MSTESLPSLLVLGHHSRVSAEDVEFLHGLLMWCRDSYGLSAVYHGGIGPFDQLVELIAFDLGLRVVLDGPSGFPSHTTRRRVVAQSLCNATAVLAVPAAGMPWFSAFESAESPIDYPTPLCAVEESEDRVWFNEHWYTLGLPQWSYA